jgi:hypothetical protein
VAPSIVVARRGCEVVRSESKGSCEEARVEVDRSEGDAAGSEEFGCEGEDTKSNGKP